MNPAIMKRKKLPYGRRDPAVLIDYALRFDKKSQRELLPVEIGFANIVPAPGERVEGVLYELDDALAGRLDELEKYPQHYDRIEVTVHTDAGVQRATTYTARPEMTAPDLVPSRNYINHILAGGEGLSAAYRQRLEDLETYAGECACCHRVRKVLFVRERGRMFVLCAPCVEAKQMWGDVRGRKFSVLDTEAVMQHLLTAGQGYESIQSLIESAIRLGLIEPATAP
jgi:gamma-glutamylcyclotransferase (GGCT)/AIG2-like uncharacterized protein YtfP